MLRLRLVPTRPNIPFVGLRTIGYAVAAALSVLSLVLLLTVGLNAGVDFRGGILIEMRTEAPADLAAMRDVAGKQGLGDVGLQGFGEPRDVLIRVAHQAGGEAAQSAAVEKLRAVFTEALGAPVAIRRVEVVGPQVSQELVVDGALALGIALVAMLIYIWVRFEWQFGAGALLALTFDTLTTFGLISALGIEFNLTLVAAILTVVGYSINDKVVVYDRIRENLRKFRQMPLAQLITLSLNETLSRTINTGITTLLALFALLIFGGEVIRGFNLSMIWGISIGTLSSMFIAAPVLLYLDLNRGAAQQHADAATASSAVTTASP
ncbi:MAG: protein translocase subunit SecF [Alphaproteobacteria bacterium]|nr:protein translocase subunit SecF [Alphaproteobacteria bacterium]